MLWADAPKGKVPSVASTYDGYLYNETTGAIVGTIQVKVGKPNAKTGQGSYCRSRPVRG